MSGIQTQTYTNMVLAAIDPAFVLPLEHRPDPNHAQIEQIDNSIPVIDLDEISFNPNSRQKIVAQVGTAAAEWGFFQVINHGVDLGLLQELEHVAKEFFYLPLEEKGKVRRSFENPLGYYDTEHTKNVRDWKEVFDFVPRGQVKIPNGDGLEEFENQWPGAPSGFRETCERWAAATEELAFKLLELLSESLGLPATYFNLYFEEDTTLMRLNYYAKCPAPDLVLGVSRHTDSGALTVLVQDEVGGLEVKRKDGQWIRVKPHRNAFVINVGDIFQVWSNDKYVSVEHRVVVNKESERFSCPLFFNPSYETWISPVPALLNENDAHYQPYNWGEFYRRRNDGNFKKLGVENIQIHHYAVKP